MRKIRTTAHLIIIIIITAFWFSFADAGSVLRVCDLTQRPFSLNPFRNIDIKTVNMMRLIMGPWLDRKNAFEITGGIFKTWRQQSDTVWIFTIQEGLKFHDNSPFTPEDAVFSINKVISKTSALAKEFSTIKSVTIISENSIRVETKAPDPILLSRFAGRVFCVSKRIFQELGETRYFDSPTGIGAYRFVSMDAEKLILKKNHRYYKPIKGADTIEYHFIRDKNERIRAIKENKIDILAEVPVDLYDDLLKAPDISVKRVLAAQFLKLSFNAIPEFKGVFQDIDLRKAVTYGVDIYRIIYSQFPSIPAIAIPTIVTKNDFGFNPKLRPRRADKVLAKKLLRQYMRKNGITGRLKLKFATVAFHKDICENIKKQLEQIGIDVEIITLSRSDLINRVVINKEIQVDAFINSPYNVLLDAEFQLSIHYDGGVTTWYFNREVQKVLSQARKEMDAEKRKQLLMKVQEMVYNDYATLPLYQRSALYAVSKSVNNFNVFPDVFLRLENVVIE